MKPNKNNQRISTILAAVMSTSIFPTSAFALDQALLKQDVIIQHTDTSVIPSNKEYPNPPSAQVTRATSDTDVADTSDAHTQAPSIPGYTCITDSSHITTGKYYMIVSKSQNDELFAFYPNPDYKDTDPGNVIVDGHEKGAPANAFVAKLTVNGDQISAVHQMTGGKTLDLDDLAFRIRKESNQYAFLGNKHLYLSLAQTMLSEKAGLFSIAFSDNQCILHNPSDGGDHARYLTFNEKGTGDFAQHNTNWWGAGKQTGGSVYLYAKNNADAPTITDALKNLVQRAESMISATQEGSLPTLSDQLTKAQALLQDSSVQQDAIDAMTESLKKEIQNASLMIKPKPESIAKGAPPSGITNDQPFAKGTGESKYFRIPALTTLSDGTLVAAIDARWNQTGDGGGLDTMLSISKDNGKTWSYSFPNFFNDTVNAFSPTDETRYGTSFIDPVIVRDHNDTLYLMVDLFPGGVALNTVPFRPDAHTGFETVNGKQRLVLYDGVGDAQHDDFQYYVGDFADDGFAPVFAKNDAHTVLYYVDQSYYLYDQNKEHLYCRQLGSEQFVEENVFFYHARIHVREATYLWLTKSTDGGQTWGTPMILNPQVRKTPDRNVFYGAGPGVGLTLDDGTVLLPAYTFSDQKSSFIYSANDGVTWERSSNATSETDWSSESVLVQIDENTVRHFYRDGIQNLRYTDHVRGENGWRPSAPVPTSATKTTNNQLSAIRYSKLINGKPAILVSTANGSSNNRVDGVIHVFLLNDDHTMELFCTYPIMKGMFDYSTLTELKDGSIGLIYETRGDEVATNKNDFQIIYENIAINHIIGAHAKLTEPDHIELTPNETKRIAVDSSCTIKSQTNSKSVHAEIKQEGGASFLDLTGLKEGYAKVLAGEHLYEVTVKPSRPDHSGHDDPASASKPSKPNMSNKPQQPDHQPDSPQKPSASAAIIPTVAGDPAAVNGYVDVKSHESAEAITWAVTNKLLTGISNTQFAPDENMTRAMLVTVLHRLAGRPQADETPFVDVPSNAYYRDAAAWANAHKIVTSIGENQFAPANPITREQFAVSLYRYAGSPEVPHTPLPFTDANKVSTYALDAMQWAIEKGVIHSRKNQMLNPNATVNRAEVATVLMRFTEALTKNDTVHSKI